MLGLLRGVGGRRSVAAPGRADHIPRAPPRQAADPDKRPTLASDGAEPAARIRARDGV